MKIRPVQVLLACLAFAMSIPAFAQYYGRDRYEQDQRQRDGYDHERRHERDGYDQGRYEREREQERYEEQRRHEMERERYGHDNHRGGCRVEGGYDREGYYHERQVCPEPEREVVITAPVPFIPFPPGIPLPPGVHFR